LLTQSNIKNIMSYKRKKMKFPFKVVGKKINQDLKFQIQELLTNY
ncbi:unnamed protein product, partial [marine sediment metagenome]